MSYLTGEAALLALIQAMPEFDRRNAARADWKPLSSGASDHYAVLKPGLFTNAQESIGAEATVTTWRTIVEVWQRWVDDGPTAIALQELAQRVIEHLEGYPSLGGAALLAWVAGGGEMQQRWTKEGGPMWAVWEVYVDWQEERFISVAE